MFAKNGFYQSTIAQIARQAGVADGTIYLYFKNKDDILYQFFEHKAKRIFDSFRHEVSGVDSAEQKLRVLIRRHLSEFQADMNMAIVFQAETHQSHKNMEVYLNDLSRMYLDLVGEIVELGQEEGAFRRDLYLSLVKRVVLGAVNEVINTWVLAGGKYELVTMGDPLVDLFLNGIREPVIEHR